MANETLPAIPQGWQCPVCGIVYAPFVRECVCSRKKPEDNSFKPDTFPNYGGWHLDEHGKIVKNSPTLPPVEKEIPATVEVTWLDSTGTMHTKTVPITYPSTPFYITTSSGPIKVDGGPDKTPPSFPTC